MVAITTAAGEAAVVEARQARLVLVVAQDAAKGASMPEPTGAVAAAREKAQEGVQAAHEGVQHGAADPLPPDRLRARARTTAK